MKKKKNQHHKLNNLEKKAVNEANEEYINFSEKITDNNKFYYWVIAIVVLLLVGLFLLLHFTNVI